MGLTHQSGSSTSTPPSNQGTPGEVTIRPSDDLAHMPFISDTNLNRYSIDTSQYASATKSLVGFMKGKRVVVNYYRLLNREGVNNRSNVADLPNARNVADTEYQKIIGLEITLPKGFEFDTNADLANMEVSGEAMFYPNMNPNIGDIFLVGVGDGRVGMCRISSVKPMTWRTDRIYSVNFQVQEFLEHAISDQLEGSTTLVSYFSKENYLGGTAALLSEQSYLQLIKIKEQRIILSRMYHQLFFDNTLNSYVHPNGTYDPYVVLFMTGKLRMADVNQRPRNMLGQLRDEYERTLWGRLEDEHNNTMVVLNANKILGSYGQTRMGVYVTELHNRRIVQSVTSAVGAEPYVFTSKFYTEDKANMTAYELLTWKAIVTKSIDSLTTLIVDFLDPVFRLTPEEQFYKIPLCIHFIDMALRTQYRESDAPGMGYVAGDD